MQINSVGLQRVKDLAPGAVYLSVAPLSVTHLLWTPFREIAAFLITSSLSHLFRIWLVLLGLTSSGLYPLYVSSLTPFPLLACHSSACREFMFREYVLHGVQFPTVPAFIFFSELGCKTGLTDLVPKILEQLVKQGLTACRGFSDSSKTTLRYSKLCGRSKDR